MPLVFINGYHRIPNVSYVANDEALGTRQALEYLTGLGHKRILFVRGENSDSYTVKEGAYRAFMTERGLFDEGHIVDIGEGNNIDTVTSARIKLMKTIPTLDPTAIFCCNDLMATGAIRACKRLGLSVPEDISVSKLVEPQNTTLDQNMFQLGSNAAAVLVEMIHGGQSKRITLENILITRESTGPCKIPE